VTPFTLPPVEILSVSQDTFGQAHVLCRFLGQELADVRLDVATLERPPQEVQALLESAVISLIVEALRCAR
jgi:hypothetical protein